MGLLGLRLRLVRLGLWDSMEALRCRVVAEG